MRKQATARNGQGSGARLATAIGTARGLRLAARMAQRAQRDRAAYVERQRQEDIARWN